MSCRSRHTLFLLLSTFYEPTSGHGTSYLNASKLERCGRLQRAISRARDTEKQKFLSRYAIHEYVALRHYVFYPLSRHEFFETFFNLSRWNDVPRTSRIFFLSRVATFLSVLGIFERDPGKRNDKFITFLIISIQRCHADEFERKRKRRIIVYDSVTRYGPQINHQRKLTSCTKLQHFQL